MNEYPLTPIDPYGLASLCSYILHSGPLTPISTHWTPYIAASYPAPLVWDSDDARGDLGFPLVLNLGFPKKPRI